MLHPPPDVHTHNVLTAVAVGLAAVVVGGLLPEPRRQRAAAVVMAVAAGAYLNGGFGVWEFPFAVLVGCCAYGGLRSYRFLGGGWVLHTLWDVAHHAAGLPLISWLPTSSAECAVTDLILAGWLFAGAPSLSRRHVPTSLEPSALAAAAAPVPTRLTHREEER